MNRRMRVRVPSARRSRVVAQWVELISNTTLRQPFLDRSREQPKDIGNIKHARSTADSEYMLQEPGVVGSSPTGPTVYQTQGCSSVVEHRRSSGHDFVDRVLVSQTASQLKKFEE